MTADLKIDTRQFDRLIKRIGSKADDGTRPLSQLDRAVKTDMARAVNKAKAATGGEVRGQKWAPMKPQYTRKDGTVVPAWGGVAKVHGRGKVKGKKRPSGQRVKRTSVINKDTQHLVSAVLTLAGGKYVGPARIRGKKTLTIGGVTLPKYGKAIFGHDNRNLLRWQKPKDVQTYKKIAAHHLRKLIKEARARG